MNGECECSERGFTTRDFRIMDYEEVIALWRICGLPFRQDGRDNRERIAKEIEKPTALFLVAECCGDIVATLFGTTDGRKGWINRLAVRPDHRRKGLAKRLIEDVETRFEALGLEIYSCLIEDHSLTSMKLFENVGYRQDPTVHYYSKRLKDDS